MFPHDFLSDLFLKCCLFSFILTIDIFVNAVESVPLIIKSWKILNFSLRLHFSFLDTAVLLFFCIFFGKLKIFLKFAFLLNDHIKGSLLLIRGLFLKLIYLLSDVFILFSFMMSECDIIRTILAIFLLYFSVNCVAHFDLNLYKINLYFYSIHDSGIFYFIIWKRKNAVVDDLRLIVLWIYVNFIFQIYIS